MYVSLGEFTSNSCVELGEDSLIKTEGVQDLFQIKIASNNNLIFRNCLP